MSHSNMSDNSEAEMSDLATHVPDTQHDSTIDISSDESEDGAHAVSAGKKLKAKKKAKPKKAARKRKAIEDPKVTDNEGGETERPKKKMNVAKVAERGQPIPEKARLIREERQEHIEATKLNPEQELERINKKIDASNSTAGVFGRVKLATQYDMKHYVRAKTVCDHPKDTVWITHSCP